MFDLNFRFFFFLLSKLAGSKAFANWLIKPSNSPSTKTAPERLSNTLCHWLQFSFIVFPSKLGFCTLCFCFPTKMLHLNAPILPLKCSISPKKSLKCSDNAHYTNGFLINFNIFNIVLTVNTYKNIQVLEVTRATASRSHKENQHGRLDS